MYTYISAFRGCLLLTCATLVSCATYRSAGGDFRGIGSYKSPSDYSSSSSSGTRSAHGYSPRAPFKLVWPVENVHINRGFHPANDPAHEGLDLGGSRGFPIMAAHEGVVIYRGQDFRGYGKMVLIEYNHEWATLYGHLDQITVQQGQVVTPGDLIGKMGATGHASGVHLHFELMHNRNPTDPLPFLMHQRKLTSTFAKQLHSENQGPRSQTPRPQ